MNLDFIFHTNRRKSPVWGCTFSLSCMPSPPGTPCELPDKSGGVLLPSPHSGPCPIRSTYLSYGRRETWTPVSKTGEKLGEKGKSWSWSGAVFGNNLRTLNSNRETDIPESRERDRETDRER